MSVCPLCKRADVELEDHHLVPIQKGGKGGETAAICRNCHRHIHAVFTNDELRYEFNTVARLRQSSRMRKFIRFVRKRPYKHHLRTRRSRRTRRKK